MASLIKRWRTGDGRIGGLFGSPLGTHQTTLNWGREQQAAFLIFAWEALQDSVVSSNAPWTSTLLTKSPASRYLLFSGPDTLIATDQGVRGFLRILNDLLVVDFDEGNLDLTKWEWEPTSGATEAAAVSSALTSLQQQMPLAAARIRLIANALSSFDWRVSSAIPTIDPQYSTQASYRGSSGYKEIRRQLLKHIHDSEPLLQSLVDKVDRAVTEKSDEGEQ